MNCLCGYEYIGHSDTGSLRLPPGAVDQTPYLCCSPSGRIRRRSPPLSDVTRHLAQWIACCCTDSGPKSTWRKRRQDPRHAKCHGVSVAPGQHSTAGARLAKVRTQARLPHPIRPMQKTSFFGRRIDSVKSVCPFLENDDRDNDRMLRFASVCRRDCKSHVQWTVQE